MCENILIESFDKSELFLDKYHDVCVCYVLSDDYKLHTVDKNEKIKFTPASVIFYNEKLNLIQILAVGKNYRGKKYGYYLIKYVSLKYDNNISLHVRNKNINAIKLYESLGFKIVKTIKDYYSYTNINEDAHHMILYQ